VPYADHDFFQENSRNLIRISIPVEERSASFRALYDYLDALIAKKIGNPGDDLLSTLVERIESGELTRRDAAGIGVLLLIAGHETTANMIALGTLALLEHPDQLSILRSTEDPKQIAGAVEELLRYLNITHNGRRRVALEDIEIGGRTIRAGDGIILPNDIGNRDPDVFGDPDRLDLGRDARSTSRSASASTSAWVSRWPGWSSRSSTGPSTSASPACGSRPPSTRSRSSTTAPSTASTNCP
jgi:cytochrome P450